MKQPGQGRSPERKSTDWKSPRDDGPWTLVPRRIDLTRTPQRRERISEAQSALLERLNIVAVQVKDGTPLFGPSLCETCSNAHIEKGYRESEQFVFCTVTYFEHRVPFRVRQCSGYREVKRQTLKQMEDIAWILPASGNKRTAGFAPPRTASNDDKEDITLVLDKKK